VVGVLTFSKPPYIAILVPIVALAALRRQWRRGATAGLVFAGVSVGLWGGNVAVTGELNYQGGERKTFYGGQTDGVPTGFPFLTPAATFDRVGLGRGTDGVPTDIVFSARDSLTVLRHNVGYFIVGRHTGLLPYFFPALVAAALFLVAPRRRPVWQWLVGGTAVASALALLLWLPFTYSGGGAPIGNRYYMPFYALFLFLTPALASVRPGLVALAGGSLFTAQLVVNPFYVSSHPAEHPKTGPYRWLPVELSLLNDLPINVQPGRVRVNLAGDPPMQAFFLDNNAYGREGEWFWVRGESQAEVILRGGARVLADGRAEAYEIERLDIEVRSGDVGNRVTIDTGQARQTVDMGPRESRPLRLDMPAGLPYRALPEQPTSYVYAITIDSQTGFTPMFTDGASDSRYLGAFVRLVPVYRVPGA
jgi:hypothetical protein